MDNESVRKYLIDFQERPLPEVHSRQVQLSVDSRRIQVVIGARRSGKTWLFYDTIKRIVSAGVPKEACLYLNFEHPLLDGITCKDMTAVLEIYFTLFAHIRQKRLHIFIDEPQVVKMWETMIRGMHDDGEHALYVTGSSSKLLSKEIATSLRGRALSKLLLPLSFREFIAFKHETDLDIGRLSTRKTARVIELWNEFCIYGGYPEIVGAPDMVEKAGIIKDYFDMTIYKDIVERYHIRNSALIRQCMRAAISSAAQQFNSNKVYLSLKSQGFKISKTTVYEYFSILEDCLFSFLLRRYDTSLRKEDSSIPKLYLNDTGFLNLFSGEVAGRRLENIVFLELTRRIAADPFKKIHYWRSREDKEVDFLISRSGKVVSAVQVCCQLNDQSVRQREFSALAQCMEFFKLKKGLIVTTENEGVERINGVDVDIVPAWKWALGLTTSVEI